MVGIFHDTIAAIATPLGTAGVGVVRISGGQSLEVAKKIFKGKGRDFEPNRAYYGWVHDNGELVDEVIVLYFEAPNSFTGEDVCEIQCHGGIKVVKNILNLCLSAGARLADKGEFSKRAFVNGKMDLSKAEAVLDLIHARTDRFARESVLNLSGKLAQKIRGLRADVLELLAEITAAVDFPEDVEEPCYASIRERVDTVIRQIDSILSGSLSSNLMRDGLKVAIVGRPNAGKSSLFNALLDMDRAIVTEIPGTTRDIIQESIDIEGVPVTLIDTAGLRESDDYIESIGINLTKNVLESSDVVLHVFDLSEGREEKDFETKNTNIIKVGSKADLVGDDALDCAAVAVSSVNRAGLDRLKKEIVSKYVGNTDDGEFCTNTRQQECLRECEFHLEKVLEGCKNEDPQDLISIDLKSALVSLGEITGEVVSEEILDNIFSNFCIGK